MAQAPEPPSDAQHDPTPGFEADESLAQWTVPAKEWLSTHDKHWDGIASFNLVFNDRNQVLIVQRASHDSMPNLWEAPGGAVDAEDVSILHGAARELREEASLVARRFNHSVSEGPGLPPGQVFTNRTGTRVYCRFAFDVDVVDVNAVKLDPHEHQDFAWATEEEIREQKMGERPIPSTHEGTRKLFLEGFRLRREKAGLSG